MVEFTCLLFREVPESIYRARADMIEKYGLTNAIRGMILESPKEKEI